MAATEESEAGHGQSIPQVHGGIQAGGRGAVREIGRRVRRGGARAGLRRGQPVGLGKADTAGPAPDANPFQMAEDLRRLKRENERLKRENEMLLKASALFAGRQL